MRTLPAALSELWEPEWCRDHSDYLSETADILGVDFPSGAWAVPGWIDANPEDFGQLCAEALAVADPALVVASDYDDRVADRIADTAAQIVSEVASETGALHKTLEDMDEELRSFCGANPDLVYDAAFAMGRLPQGASGDLETYWAVTRPLEYAAACEQAFASH
jgi:hypothetical protein